MTGNVNTQVNPQTAPAPQRLRPSGGGSERPPVARPAAARPAEPPRQEPSDQTDPTAAAPVCPACGKAMLLRTARKGPKAGSQFWGCSGFPECRKTLQV